jgi:hypothetical protein
MARSALPDPDERPEDARMSSADRDEMARVRAMTPSARLAEAIELSRVATRLAADAPEPRR